MPLTLATFLIRQFVPLMSHKRTHEYAVSATDLSKWLLLGIGLDTNTVVFIELRDTFVMRNERAPINTITSLNLVSANASLKLVCADNHRMTYHRANISLNLMSAKDTQIIEHLEHVHISVFHHSFKNL